MRGNPNPKTAHLDGKRPGGIKGNKPRPRQTLDAIWVYGHLSADLSDPELKVPRPSARELLKFVQEDPKNKSWFVRQMIAGAFEDDGKESEESDENLTGLVDQMIVTYEKQSLA